MKKRKSYKLGKGVLKWFKFYLDPSPITRQLSIYPISPSDSFAQTALCALADENKTKAELKAERHATPQSGE